MKWQFKEDHTLGKFYHSFTTFLPPFTHIVTIHPHSPSPWDEQGWRKNIENYILDQRCQESNKIRQKYPDRIPVIVQKVEGSNIEKIDKRKYLVSWLLKINPHPPYGPHILIKWPYKFNIKSINQYFIGSSRYYRRPIYVDYPKKNKLAIRTSHFLIRWQNGATIKVSFWIFPNWMIQFLDNKNLDFE